MSNRTNSLNAYEVATTSAVGDSSLTIPVETVTGLTVPLYLAIDPDDPTKREYFKVTAINGNNLEVGALANRGLLGTTGGLPLSHDNGATVRAVAVSQWLNDIFNDIEELEAWDTNHVADADAHTQYIKQAGDAMNGFLSVYANPTQDLHAVPKQYLESQLALTVPAGVITAFGGEVAPDGYLLCRGDEISRAAYPALFAAIGEAYGAGDGSTTFLLPDLRSRMPVGQSTDGFTPTDELGESGGSMQGTVDFSDVAISEVDDHSHAVSGQSGIYNNFFWATDLDAGSAQHIPRSDHTHSINFTSGDGGAHGHSASGQGPVPMPAYQVVNYIVKT